MKLDILWNSAFMDIFKHEEIIIWIYVSIRKTVQCKKTYESKNTGNMYTKIDSF